MDEAELVGAAAGGDRQAFDELVRRTFVDTFTLARRLTGNEEDARDVVQEAYLRAWKGIGKFRGEAAFSTWLYRITANAAASNVAAPAPPARRAVRRRLRARRHERRGSSVSQGAESAEALDRIAAALDELPAKLRSVVVLKDVYGLSHEAIADELGITVSAAKVRLHRARRKLRDVLYEEGARGPCGVTR